MKYLLILPIALVLGFVTPGVVSAQVIPNLIVCDDKPSAEGQPAEDPCDFEDLIELIMNLIDALVIVSTFIATFVFAWGGIKLLTSAGNPSAMTETKTMLTKVLLGYVWILAAWLLVYTITSVLLEPEYNEILGEPQPTEGINL